MLAKCFGEFMGTLVLVLLGDGVVAGVLLKRSKAEGAGWMVITSGWAFAVTAGVFVAIACGSSDAHLNPAVTLGFAVSSGQFAKLAPYIVAQMAGAFVGGALVWLHFLPHWKETPDQGLKLAVFCTAPAIRRFGANLLSEIIGTFVLVFVVGAIFSYAVGASGPQRDSAPISSVHSSGASVFPSVAPPGTPSIPRATSARASPTRLYPSRARARPTGATPSCPSSALSSEAALPALFSVPSASSAHLRKGISTAIHHLRALSAPNSVTSV